MRKNNEDKRDYECQLLKFSEISLLYIKKKSGNFHELLLGLKKFFLNSFFDIFVIL